LTPDTKYSHIIWDWNGTLLDDLQLCLNVINTLLSKRQLPKVSKEEYLDIFGFPVIDYYRKLGFDFSMEPFETISTEFIDAYEKGRPDCRLMPGAWDTLYQISLAGLTQSILSASKQDHLNKAISDYGLNDLFCSINGLDNHHAAGKVEIARSFMFSAKVDPKRTILIGDTIHDAEIASELGIDCWLIPNGHQSRNRLSSSNYPLIDSLPLVKKTIIS
jgi:phosphoglycolate phosphatase